LLRKQKIIQFIKKCDREEFLVDELPGPIRDLNFNFDSYSDLYLDFSCKYNLVLEIPTCNFNRKAVFKTRIKYPLKQIIRYANDIIRLYTDKGGDYISLRRKIILNHSDFLAFEEELANQVSYKNSKFAV